MMRARPARDGLVCPLGILSERKLHSLEEMNYSQAPGRFREEATKRGCAACHKRALAKHLGSDACLDALPIRDADGGGHGGFRLIR